MKHAFFRSVCAVIFFMLPCVLLPAQAAGNAGGDFPGGATQGVTGMPDPTQRTVVPFIDLQIREPATNQEVAFSVQILLLLTD